MPRSKESSFVNESASARLITRILNSSEKSQAEIAQEIGFEKPNIITMMKQGRIKMPIARIPAFCKATNSDPALLLDVVLEENHPEIRAVLLEVKGFMVSDAEAKMVRAIRAAKLETERSTKKRLTWKTDQASISKLKKTAATLLRESD